MNHVSVKTIESQKYPGVRFVLKRMNRRRVDALDELQAPIRERLKPLYEEYGPLDKEFTTAKDAALALVKPRRDKLIDGGMNPKYAAAQVPIGKIDFAEEKFMRRIELRAQIDKIDVNELAPSAVRYCLVRIEGLDITYPDAEGIDVIAPASLDLIMQHGPDELYAEILHEVIRECGLLPDEVENLESPSTSAAAVDGSSANAGLVETPETITASAV